MICQFVNLLGRFQSVCCWIRFSLNLNYFQTFCNWRRSPMRGSSGLSLDSFLVRFAERRYNRSLIMLLIYLRFCRPTIETFDRIKTRRPCSTNFRDLFIRLMIFVQTHSYAKTVTLVKLFVLRKIAVSSGKRKIDKVSERYFVLNIPLKLSRINTSLICCLLVIRYQCFLNYEQYEINRGLLIV